MISSKAKIVKVKFVFEARTRTRPYFAVSQTLIVLFKTEMMNHIRFSFY